jgi:hypothetical protein
MGVVKLFGLTGTRQESEDANDKGTGKLMLWLSWSNIAGAFIFDDIGISGLVVGYIGAIDVTWVCSPADAICVFCDGELREIASQPAQDHILLWSWRAQVWHQFYDNGLPEFTGPLNKGNAIVSSHFSKMSFATPCTNA